MHNDKTALIKINDQISISTFNERNLKIQGSGTGGDAGITGYSGNGSHVFQIYGSGSNYGLGNAQGSIVAAIKHDGRQFLQGCTG